MRHFSFYCMYLHKEMCVDGWDTQQPAATLMLRILSEKQQATLITPALGATK